jgi:CRP/FNR family cyclic AMP-dependent transcriptional regulator
MGLRVGDEVFKRYGRVYKAGEVIFCEGDAGETMFIIQEGEVRIHKRVREKETTLAVLKDGEFFGEMAIIDKEPRSASATALTDSKLIVLSDEIFESQIKNNPKIIMAIVRKMSERLRNADRQIKMLLMRDTHSRVIGTLTLLVSKRGVVSEKGYRIPWKETVGELSNMTGLPMERVEEVFETLTRANVASRADADLVIHDTDDLERFMTYLEMKDEFGV